MRFSTIIQVLLVLAVYDGKFSLAQITAPPGLPGLQGEQGPDGPPGLPGDPGDVGPTGADGLPGPKGETGDMGVSGEPGIDGPTGAPGSVGATGFQGVAGVSGQPGLPGEPGDVGATGGVGATGVKGPKGPKGEKGDRGDPGVKGAPGEKGDVGMKGERGIIGSVGVKGDKGVVGLPGRSLLEMDINECDPLTRTHSCDLQTSECVNLATGYRCECKLGYSPIAGDLYKCQDVNECLVDNGGCEGTCQNSNGSYVCSCDTSRYILTDSNQCADINECLDKTLCDEDNSDLYCVNSPGSYACVSSLANNAEATTPRAPAAQRLMLDFVKDSWIIGLLIWLGAITLVIIVILIYLFAVFYAMKKEKDLRNQINDAYGYNNDGAESLSGYNGVEDLADSGAIDIDIPRLPRSQRGTMKGKGSTKGRPYKSKRDGSRSRSPRPASVSSGTGSNLQTASVRSTRVATGERNSASRLSGVDTFY